MKTDIEVLDQTETTVTITREQFEKFLQTAEALEGMLSKEAYLKTRDEESFPDYLVGKLLLRKQSPITLFREYRQLQLVDLADQISLSAGLLLDIEDGYMTPTAEVISLLAKALNVDDLADYLKADAWGKNTADFFDQLLDTWY